MKIKITSESKLHAGLNKASERNFYDALTLFNQVDTYEATINRIVCLACLGDYIYAADLYRIAKTKYCGEYALYQDIRTYGDIVSTFLDYCEPSYKIAVSFDGKKHADKSLLMVLEQDENDEFDTPDLNYDDDSAQFDNPTYASNKFYDIHSVEYYESLRINMERCILNGDSEGATKYSERLLAVETDHLPTLEAQISLIVFSERYRQGIVYAERLANIPGGSHVAIGGAIEILTRIGPDEHMDALKKLLNKALDILEYITLFDLADYIYYATTYVYDLDMAYKFAKELYKEYKNIGLDALKLCASAFFNVGDDKLAKEAAISLYRAVPFDCYAKLLVEFFNRNPYTKNQAPMETAPRMLRHFVLPSKLMVYTNRQLYKLLGMDGQNALLGELELFYTSVLMLHSKSLMFVNNTQEYMEMAVLIKGIITDTKLEDEELFVAFAKEHLFSIMSDQSVQESLIARLLKLGYDGSAFVTLANASKYYRLDFSAVPKLGDLFADVIAVCATVRQVEDIQKYVTVFNDVLEKLQPAKSDGTTAHNIAYTILCECVKGFARSEDVDMFDEKAQAFYDRYLELKS